MNLFSEIVSLLRKDLLLEFRLKYAISGILLYVLSTVFIVFTAFREIPAVVWNAVFWVVILFAAVNAIGKSFLQEGNSRQLYYYTLANPVAIILAKMVYNITLMIVLSLLCWLGFSFIAGNKVIDTGLFILALLLGSIGFSIAFTFTSAIASKARNSATLMAILSFPLIIPIIMTLIKLSGNALELNMFGTRKDNSDLFILLGIDGMLIGMSLILFPFLWRD